MRLRYLVFAKVSLESFGSEYNYCNYRFNLTFLDLKETQEQYNRRKVELEQKLLREKAELAKVSGSKNASNFQECFPLRIRYEHLNVAHAKNFSFSNHRN